MSKRHVDFTHGYHALYTYKPTSIHFVLKTPLQYSGNLILRSPSAGLEKMDDESRNFLLGNKKPSTVSVDGSGITFTQIPDSMAVAIIID